MAEEAEYVVETILRAKVISFRGQLIWNYYVKWKGYDDESENTWEPVASFNDSEHFIETFWSRIRDKRDHNDISQFRANEEVVPTGPPRRKKTKQQAKPTPKTSKPKPKYQAPKSVEEVEGSEVEVESIIDVDEEVQRSSRKRRGSSDAEYLEAPAPKRTRKPSMRADQEEPAKMQPKLSKRRSVPSLNTHPSKSNASASTPSSRRKRPPGRRASSLLASPSGDGNGSQVTSPPVASSSKDDVEDEVPGSVSDGPEPPAPQSGEDVPEKATGLSWASMPKTPKPMSTTKLPAHRERAANPRMKLFEEPMISEASGSISVKAKLSGWGPASAREGIKFGSASRPVPARITAAINPVSRTGPSRSSGALSKFVQTGSSSVLTASKGKLTTVGRKVKGILKPQADEGPVVNNDKNDEIAGDDVVMLDESDEPHPDNNDASADAEPPVTGEKLLELAGLDVADGQALHDFEEDAEGEVDDNTGHQQIVEDLANVNNAVSSTAINGSAATVESQKKEGVTTATTSSSFQAAWKQTTIFGPLGIGNHAPTSPVQDVDNGKPSESSRPTFSVVLDPSVSLPVVLKDIHPPSVPSQKPLNEVVMHANDNLRLPGKFYKDDYALALVSAFRAKGSCARIMLGVDTDTETKRFDRFRERLKTGELFVLMVGSSASILAFCSSENTVLGSKLGMSPELIGLGDNILVSEVTIEDDGGYIEAVGHAVEDERW